MNQFIRAVSPKRLFRSKKNRSIRSDPSSYSYGAASSSSSCSDSSSSGLHDKNGRDHVGSPTGVLPEISSDWSYISSDFVSDLAQAFKLMDKDNDGIVSRTQLESLLIRLGAEPPSQEEVATMLSEVDCEGDGCISVEALVRQMGSACEPAGNDELRVAFEFFDRDHDGKITAEELMGVFKAMGDEECTLDDCRRMIGGVDKKGDGFVCFQDFARMMELQERDEEL